MQNEQPAPYEAAPTRYDAAERLYARCGRSGVLLPRLSLGFWQNFGADVPFEHSRALVRHAFDCGITHFDLADNYGPPYGAAERTLGRLLREDLRPYRDELFIATKAGYDMWPGPYGNWGSRKHLLSGLDRSLERLNVDYVDLFYSHRYDPATPLEETLQALVDVVRAGKALYVGISRWPLPALRTAHAYLRAHGVPLLVYQGRLNLLDRAPIDEGVLAFCREQGIGFASFSPLAEGLLTARYLDGVPRDSRMARGRHLKAERLTPQLLRALRRLNEQAAAQGSTLAAAALAWVLAQKGVTTVIVGASRVEQLDENLRCIGTTPPWPTNVPPLPPAEP